MVDTSDSLLVKTIKFKVQEIAHHVDSERSSQIAKGFRRLRQLLQHGNEEVLDAIKERCEGRSFRTRLSAARIHESARVRAEAGKFDNLLHRRVNNQRVLGQRR